MVIPNTMGVESATMPRDVLIPTDGSPLSADALEQAITTFPDGDITLIYVDDPPIHSAGQRRAAAGTGLCYPA